MICLKLFCFERSLFLVKRFGHFQWRFQYIFYFWKNLFAKRIKLQPEPKVPPVVEAPRKTAQVKKTVNQNESKVPPPVQSKTPGPQLPPKPTSKQLPQPQDLPVQGPMPASASAAAPANKAATAPVVKVPYAILNDKRDFITIQGTLEKKLNELISKNEFNRFQVMSGPSTGSSTSIKLARLERAYQAQREKIERQLEYVRLSLHIDQIRRQLLYNNGANMPPTALASLEEAQMRLADMHAYMKVRTKFRH